jgi:hypothetical protein
VGHANRAKVDGGAKAVNRAQLLKAGALGVVGVVGAGAALQGSTGTASARSVVEGQTSFANRTTTPTVTITNQGTGSALAVNAATKSPASIIANSSRTVGAYAVVGFISSRSPGFDSAAVKGANNGRGSAGIGVYGIQAGSGYGVYGYRQAVWASLDEVRPAQACAANRIRPPRMRPRSGVRITA